MEKRSKGYIISVIVGAVIVALVCVRRELWEKETAQAVFRVLCDAAFAAGAILTGFGLLSWISYNGNFDMLRYSVQLGIGMFRGKEKREELGKDFYEYQQKREGKRKKGFAPLLLVGGAYLLLAVVFLILFYQM